MASSILPTDAFPRPPRHGVGFGRLAWGSAEVLPYALVFTIETTDATGAPLAFAPLALPQGNTAPQAAREETAL
jgi:hypothetical protein